MKFHLASALFATLALVPSTAAAQQVASSCQHRRAENVVAHYATSGVVNACNDYWVILGFRISQHTTPCPTSQAYHPAHQVCSGTPSYGTNCVLDGDVSAYSQDCSCVSTGGVMIGSVTEHCECSAFTESGTLEDWKTTDCILVVPPLG